MPQGTNTSLSVDVTRINDPEVRRAIRSTVQQMQEVIDRQQIEIESLLEMMLDKHIGSLGEFKRYVQKIQQRATERTERVHVQLSQTLHDHPQTQPSARPAAEPEELESPDEGGRHVYRL